MKHRTDMTTLVVMIEYCLIIGTVALTERALVPLLLEEGSTSTLDVFAFELDW
jgi:hypothetical protein